MLSQTEIDAAISYITEGGAPVAGPDYKCPMCATGTRRVRIIAEGSVKFDLLEPDGRARRLYSVLKGETVVCVDPVHSLSGHRYHVVRQD